MTYALARGKSHVMIVSSTNERPPPSSTFFITNPKPNPAPKTLLNSSSNSHPQEMVLGERPLSIDVEESMEGRIQRLISENPVIIFSRTSCCMCHVMKRLLASIGVHPTVIELDDEEIEMARSALTAAAATSAEDDDRKPDSVTPAVFIGGALVGGLEGLMGLHLSGQLVPKLKEVGSL